jgi:hypothetical protein
MKEERRREKKDETAKKTESVRHNDDESRNKRDRSVERIREGETSERIHEKSGRHKTKEKEPDRQVKTEAIKQTEEQKPKQSESEKPRKPTGNEKKPKHSKHGRARDDKEKHRSKIEKKSMLQHPEANRLGMLSPDLSEGFIDDHRDKDRKVEKRERELMAALAMEEHNRKMQQRLQLLDDSTDVDSEPEPQHSRGSQLAAPSLRMEDDGIASEPEEGLNRDDYRDEEFESYDEDFEDEAETDNEQDDNDDNSNENDDNDGTDDDNDDGVDLQEVMQAIHHENKHIRSSSVPRQQSPTHSTGTTNQSREMTTSPVAVTKPHGRMTFNFVSASKLEVNEQAAKKTKKRGKELLKLIELDFVAIDVLDLAPQSEYEVYMKSYGRANTAQACVQTNEDNMDQEIQTEEIDEADKWTQHPPEDLRGSGGVSEVESEFEALTTASHYNPLAEDSIRLSKFLQRASQVCCVLLEANIAEVSQSQIMQRKTDYSFSSGFTRLATTASVFAGRHVQSMSFSPIQTNLLLTSFSVAPASHTQEDLFPGNGIICVWNLNEPSKPDKVLSCQSLTLCSCFSPNKASLAFGGTEDGSVVVWDLRESVGMHRVHKLGDREWIIRSPTYSTGCNLGSPFYVCLNVCLFVDIFACLSVCLYKFGLGLQG